MKHRGSSKIKSRNSIIQGLGELLEKIEEWEEIMSIFPAKIKPVKKKQSQVKITVQQVTPTGLKCLARSDGAVQEVFIVSNSPEALRTKLEAL